MTLVGLLCIKEYLLYALEMPLKPTGFNICHRKVHKKVSVLPAEAVVCRCALWPRISQQETV